MPAMPYLDIGGLAPAVDRRKFEKPFVVAGRNFAVDADGPISAWGYTTVAEEYAFKHKYLIQSFKIAEDYLLYFAQDCTANTFGIYVVDWANRNSALIYEGSFAEMLNAPWTTALVGGIHYFAHRSFSTMAFDPSTHAWDFVDLTPGARTYAICESAGRLIVLTDGIVKWSAIDDGMDLTPSLTTGAGFQSLSLIGYVSNPAEYMGVRKLADGFMTFTSRGMLRSTVIDSINPFRHDPKSTTHIPMNPWCFAEIDQLQHAILTVNGLFITGTGDFEPWQPLFSEFLKKQVLQILQQGVSGNVALHYQADIQTLFLSLGESVITPMYTKAYTLYLPKGEWGEFTQFHSGLVAVDQPLDTKYLSQGFINERGMLAVFTYGAMREFLQPVTSESYLGGPRPELPSMLVVDTATPNVIEHLARDRISELTMGRYQPGISGVTYVAGLPCRLTRRESVGYCPAIRLYTLIEFPAAPAVSTAFDALGVLIASDIVQIDGTLAFVESAANKALIVAHFAAETPVQLGLDSYAEMGLFRLPVQFHPDELSTIQEVIVGSALTSGLGIITEDYLAYAQDIFVDWLSSTEADEDWGLGQTATGSLFDLVVRGTLDGYSTFEDHEVTFESILETSDSLHAVGTCTGIWLTVKVAATTLGQFYALKTLDLHQTPAGRL